MIFGKAIRTNSVEKTQVPPEWKMDNGLQKINQGIAPLVLLTLFQWIAIYRVDSVIQQSRFCHITPLLFDLHWLPVKFRIEFKILLITFKALKGLARTYIDSLISIKWTSRYDLRSSNDSLLLSYPKPWSKATLGARSFTYAASKLWNALPLAIRSINTVTDFKGKLETYLFSKAFFIKIRIVL